jgi:hypothetical protein
MTINNKENTIHTDQNHEVITVELSTGKSDSTKKLHRLIFMFSYSTYVIALFLPGLAATGKNPYQFDSYHGFLCLFFGWITVFTGAWKYFLPWTANFFYGLAISMWLSVIKSPRWGTLTAILGLALSLLTFRIDTAVVNEAGHKVAVHPGLGAWLWIISFMFLIVGFLLRERLKSRYKSKMYETLVKR